MYPSGLFTALNRLGTTVVVATHDVGLINATPGAHMIRLENGTDHAKVLLSLSPLRKTVKDYFLVCDNYYKAIRTAPPHQIEALDMARRTLHDEGAAELKKRLNGKIETDFDTARRLFTLVCVLQMRG